MLTIAVSNATDRIKTLRARGVNVPLAKPIRTAAGDVTSAPLILIDLESVGGAVGRSYLFCYTALTLRALRTLVNDLASVVVGLPLAPRSIAAVLRGRLRLVGGEGLTGMAIAGIDMAAWDAVAIASGLPLHAALGAEPRALPTYDSLGMMTTAEAVSEAERSRNAGFKAIKYKISGPDVAADVAFVRAVRGAIGPSIELMVDYNQSLDRAEAVRRGTALEPFGLRWIEEPCRADDDESHAVVAHAVHTPIQLGENWWGPQHTARSIRAGACDEVMLDVMKIGGVTGWLDAASIAEAAGMRISSHIFPEISAHLLAVSPAAQYLEWLDLASAVLAAPVEPVNGFLSPSSVPGTGIAWNEAAVSKFTTE